MAGTICAERQVSRRGKNFTEYVDVVKPNKKQMTFTIHDQNYQNESGTWNEADEALESDNTVDGGVTFTNKAEKVNHRLRIANDGTRRIYPRRNVTTEYVQFGALQYRNTSNNWVNVPFGAPTRNGNIITWNQTNFAVELVHTWRHMKIEATLKNSTAARPIRWRVTLVGLTWDNWNLKGQDGKVVGTLDRPVGWDATGNAESPNITVTPGYSGGYVIFTANLSSAVYPVVIDPTFSAQPAEADSKDTRSQALAPTSNYGTNAALQMSNSGQSSYVQFDVSSIPAGATVDYATITFTSASTGYGNNVVVYSLHSNVATWTESGLTHNVYKSGTNWPGSAGCNTANTDYESTLLGSTTFPITGNTAFSINLLTSRISGWLTGSNYGLLVRRDAPDQAQAYSSNNATTGYRPKMEIGYTESGGAAAPTRRRTGRGFGGFH
jgi:hypothetical protein